MIYENIEHLFACLQAFFLRAFHGRIFITVSGCESPDVNYPVVKILSLLKFSFSGFRIISLKPASLENSGGRGFQII